VTHDEDWEACAASVDPELIEAAFAGLAADLAPGTATAAAGRQFSGTMGRVGNVIVAVREAWRHQP
jgi:hypothetical protein